MKNTVSTFKEQKVKGDKITMLTAYDYSTAKLMDQSGINGILVGDSLGMVMLGYENTLPVTMEDMIHHTRAQMYLAGKEKKMLVQHGKEIYLIDISDMYKNIQPRK